MILYEDWAGWDGKLMQFSHALNEIRVPWEIVDVVIPKLRWEMNFNFKITRNVKEEL